MTKELVQAVSNGIMNPMYYGNIEATRQLISLFDSLSTRELKTDYDYIKLYEDTFYTFRTWGELLKSEAEQYDGFSEQECVEQMGKSIWMLPCGWYVQAV